MTADERAMLRARLAELALARDALLASYRRVGSPETIDALSVTDDGRVEIEAFTSRFARLCDVSVQQVLRGADETEGVARALPNDRIARAAYALTPDLLLAAERTLNDLTRVAAPPA